MTLMAGGKALMEALRCEGVEYVFGLPGSTELLFLDALEDYPQMKYILGLHEVVPLGMAEGYARASGKPGVVNLHTCSGLATAMPMLLNAYLGGVPLVVTAGQQDTRLLMQEPHLSGDLVGIARHFTKWSAEIAHTADIPLAIRRAFKVAMQPPTGPVFLSLPQDIMTDNLDFEYESSAIQTNRMRPDTKAVARAAELLAGARSPAIIVEDGVAKNDALSEIVKLAEMTGARVYQAWMADVNFPTGHPQYMGDINPGSPATRDMLQSVDVLLVVGAPLFAPARYVPVPLLTASTRVVQIDDNPWQIAKNYPVAAGLVGNIKVSLAELIEALNSRMTDKTRAAAKARVENMAAEKGKAARALEEKNQQGKGQAAISITRLMQELRSVLKPGTIVVEESPSYAGNIQRSLDFSEPLSYLRGRGGGSIGCGIPNALGVKLAVPERPVVAVIGDGSAIWSVQGLWTAAHYHIPVTFIITANGSYRILKMAKIARMGEKVRGRYLGMDFNEPRIDFPGMARAMGVRGEKVDKADELHRVLGAAVESGEPYMVEVTMEEDR